jgi:uncharacterized protein
MNDQSEILIAMSKNMPSPKAVVLYLHTVCGDYTQLSQISNVFKDENIAYVSYTRSGNDPDRKFSSFNFVGRIEELELVINYINHVYPNTEIHAIGASAGSALLIRYLGIKNTSRRIKSAVLVSPGYHFIESCKNMNGLSKAYLVNKMKYMLRGQSDNLQLKSVRNMDDWLSYQSNLLGYATTNEYVLDCDPVHYLKSINVPSLFISSLDDNIFCGDITKKYTNLPEINENISMVVTKNGGHVIFEDFGHDIPWFLRVSQEWVLYHLSSKK